jgi:hypothetical protein
VPDGDDGLSNDDIALLCDIATFDPGAANADKQARLQSLIAEGFVEPVSGDRTPARYQLTARAQRVLEQRGAGLNEA